MKKFLFIIYLFSLQLLSNLYSDEVTTSLSITSNRGRANSNIKRVGEIQYLLPHIANALKKDYKIRSILLTHSEAKDSEPNSWDGSINRTRSAYLFISLNNSVKRPQLHFEAEETMKVCPETPKKSHGFDIACSPHAEVKISGPLSIETSVRQSFSNLANSFKMPGGEYKQSFTFRLESKNSETLLNSSFIISDDSFDSALFKVMREFNHSFLNENNLPISRLEIVSAVALYLKELNENVLSELNLINVPPARSGFYSY